MSLHVKNERATSHCSAAFSLFPLNFLSSHQPVIVIKNFPFFVKKNCALVAPVLKLDLLRVLFEKKCNLEKQDCFLIKIFDKNC